MLYNYLIKKNVFDKFFLSLKATEMNLPKFRKKNSLISLKIF